MIGPVERARTVGAAFAVPLTRRDDADSHQIHSLDALLDTVAARLSQTQPLEAGRSFDDGSNSFGGSPERRQALLGSSRQQVTGANSDMADAGLSARVAIARNDVVAARSAATQVATAARSVRAAAVALADAAGGLTAGTGSAAASAAPASTTRPVSDGGILPTSESSADIAARRAAAALASHSAAASGTSGSATGTVDLPPVGISPSSGGKPTDGQDQPSRDFGGTGQDRQQDQAEQAAQRAAAALAASRNGEEVDLPPVGNPLGRQPSADPKPKTGEEEDLPPVGTSFGDEGARRDQQQQQLIQAVAEVARRGSETLRQGKAILDALDAIKPADDTAQRALQAGLGEADREIGLAAFALTDAVESLTGTNRPAARPATEDSRKLDLSI